MQNHRSTSRPPLPSSTPVVSNDEISDEADDDEDVSSEHAHSEAVTDQSHPSDSNVEYQSESGDEEEENSSDDDDSYDENQSSDELSRATYITKDSVNANSWRRYNAEERAIGDSLQNIEAADLGTQILNSRGLRRSRSDLPLGPGTARERWTSKSVPSTWSAWPLKPSIVPRPRERIWANSFRRPETWTPSANLKQELIATMLRKARANWKGPATVDAAAKESSGQNIGHQPVFTTDDDKAQKILEPIAKSVLSQFDTVLVAMQKSCAAIHTMPRELLSKGFADWSHALSLAAACGLPSEVLSRVATRCSAAFGEQITLRTIDANSSKAEAFTPDDIARLNPSEISQRLTSSEAGFDERDFVRGCKMVGCDFWVEQQAKGRKTYSVHRHLLEHHDWPFGRYPPEDFDEHIDTHDGVHNDGFLTPIDSRYMGLSRILRTPRVYTDCRINPNADPPTEVHQHGLKRKRQTDKGRLKTKRDQVDVIAPEPGEQEPTLQKEMPQQMPHPLTTSLPHRTPLPYAGAIAQTTAPLQAASSFPPDLNTPQALPLPEEGPPAKKPRRERQTKPKQPRPVKVRDPTKPRRGGTVMMRLR